MVVKHAWTAIVTIAVMSVVQAEVTAGEVRTVVLSDWSVPGLSDAYFGNSASMMINERGEVVFKSTLVGYAIAPGTGESQWLARAGEFIQAARVGAEAPGLGEGVQVHTLFPAMLNDQGEVTSYARVAGPGAAPFDYAIWKGQAGSLSLVARTGQPAPGTATVFGELNSPAAIDARGTAWFIGEIAGEGTGRLQFGLWSSSNENLSLLARTGIPAAGTNKLIVSFSCLPMINSWGDVAYCAQLIENGKEYAGEGGTWLAASGSSVVRKMVASGDEAPGTGGLHFTWFEGRQFNNSGQLIFHAGLDKPSQEGVFTWRDGVVSKIVSTGDHAPGTADGVTFGNTTPAVWSESGRVAFVGDLSGGGPGVNETNFGGVWAGPPEAPKLVARRGDHAPGTADGQTFLGFYTPSMNASGQMVLWATLRGEGISEANDAGIWGDRGDGLLELLVREGDELEVARDDVRTIVLLEMNPWGTTTSGSGVRGFNDRGEFVFSAHFSDGTQGLFVRSVPEAGLSGFGLLFSILAAARRCRK